MSYQRYKLDPDQTETMNIRLLYITKAHYDADWKSVMHTHPFTELFYVVSGEGNVIIEQEKFIVKADDFMIINPDVSHTEYGDGIHQLEYIVLGIEGIQFLFDEDTAFRPYGLYNFCSCKNEIQYFLNHMLRELHNKNPYYKPFCHNMLECLIIFLMRQIKDVLSFESPKKAVRECRFIEQYLDKHFAEDITLQTLSDMTHLNKYYLVHIFREYKEISPINYLIQRRIQEAANLLETSDYSMSKIAHAVGFASQSYFSRVFRKEMGCSPNEYKKSAAKRKKGLSGNR